MLLKDAKVPDAKVPDAKVPDAKAPDAKAPDAKAPDAKAPDEAMAEQDKKPPPGRKSPDKHQSRLTPDCRRDTGELQ